MVWNGTLEWNYSMKSTKLIGRHGPDSHTRQCGLIHGKIHSKTALIPHGSTAHDIRNQCSPRSACASLYGYTVRSVQHNLYLQLVSIIANVVRFLYSAGGPCTNVCFLKFCLWISASCICCLWVSVNISDYTNDSYNSKWSLGLEMQVITSSYVNSSENQLQWDNFCAD